MGIYLSSPDTRKNSQDGKGNTVQYGASSMQGWRLNMEDAHISEAVFTANSSLFAVFDGHGGAEVAKFCGKYFGQELKNNPKFSKETDIKGALVDTFLKMDQMLLKPEHKAELMSMKNEPGDGDSMAGCTANVVLIHKNVAYCANAGDSRCILWGAERKVVELSTDHKPDLPTEKDRISKAGGFIIEGRVNGNLNLSRALGDLEYKKNPQLQPHEQLISGHPEIEVRTIQSSDNFLVMGCDGIWEIMTMDEICKVAEAGFKNGQKVSQIAETILDKGIAPDTTNGVGCDNMSCIVIKLNC